jgi:hypothetical protein
MNARLHLLLYGPRLKIDRADRHINELSQLIEVFLAEKPFELEIRHDPGAGERTHQIKTRKPVPDELSLLIGDAIHNLRASLDHLMFAMVGDRAANPDGIYFPFAKSDKALKDTITNRQVHLAGKKVVAELELIKPYPGGDELLNGVHVLDINDKHKLVIAVGRSAAMSADDLKKIDPAVPFVGPGVLNFVGDGDVTIRLSLPKLSRAERRHSKPTTHKPGLQPEFQVCFGNAEPFAGQALMPTLRAMSTRVREVCDRLGEAFIS